MTDGTQVARLLPGGDEQWALRTPTLPPAATTNTLVVGSDRLVVIEPATPYDEEQDQLVRALSKRVADGAQVIAICLTHHHVDHIGAVERLRRQFHAPVCAHAATADRVPFVVDVHVGAGWHLDLGDGRRVEALLTPGHAPGHVVYIERTFGLFYVGDMVASEGTILIDPDDDGDMATYLQSLERLASEFVRSGGTTMVPAHGGPLVDPVGVIRHYIAHRLAREAKVVAILQRGPCSPRELLAASYDDVRPALHMLAEKSLRAHLGKLVREGRAQYRQGQWQVSER